jgi:hypothetical protein
MGYKIKSFNTTKVIILPFQWIFLKVEMKKLDNEVLKVSVKEQLREAYRADLEDLEYVQLEFSTFL